MQNGESLDEKLIYDVGAHLGEDSDYYLKLGYRVVAIEANPQLVEKLKVRFATAIAEGRYILVPNAIGESNTEITFYINKKQSIWGTADPKWAQRNKQMGAESEEIRVQCVRFEDIVKKYGCPRYVKIDIEGADMLCINAIEQLEVRPKYVSLESSKTSWFDLLNEFNTFERLGYTRFKVIDQQKHKKNDNFKTIDGNVINHTFVNGASGPFAENLKGEWLTKRQAILKYVPIFILYKTVGDNTFLPRIIGRIPLLRRILGLVSWYDTHAMR